MSTLLDRISAVAGQLQQEGKSSSLALVRSRLGGGINPAELFSAYQNWRTLGCPVTQVAAKETVASTAINDDTTMPSRADLQRIEQKLDLILQILQDKT